MKRIAISLAALFLAVNINAEHPHEHPSGHEHPEAGESNGNSHEHHQHAQGKKPKAKNACGHDEYHSDCKQCHIGLQKDYNNYVKFWVKEGVRRDGSFKIKDDNLNKEWELKLVKVHKDRIVHLGGNKYFACSDFKSVKKGEKDSLDLDFYATKTEATEDTSPVWSMDKAIIHKVNGRPRFTYNDKNEMVPVKE